MYSSDRALEACACSPQYLQACLSGVLLLPCVVGMWQMAPGGSGSHTLAIVETETMSTNSVRA